VLNAIAAHCQPQATVFKQAPPPKPLLLSSSPGLVVALVRWRKNKYHLPRRLKLGVTAAWLLLLGTGVVGALLTSSSSFLTYSVSWFGATALVLAFGIHSEVRSSRGS
jgi:cytochrome oxidase assembly protein ShyY1